MSRFDIGDRVRPSNEQSSFADRIGVITDRMYSEAKDKFLYSVTFDGLKDEVEFKFWEEELLREVETEFVYKITEQDGVVIAVLYEEQAGGGPRKEIARNHAHILSEDRLLGYTQAASYALKKIYESLGGFNK